MANYGGIIIIAVAAILVTMGIVGSQHVLFPGIFGPAPTPAPAGVATTPQGGVTVTAPGGQPVTLDPNLFAQAVNGKCPSGFSGPYFGWLCIDTSL